MKKTILLIDEMSPKQINIDKHIWDLFNLKIGNHMKVYTTTQLIEFLNHIESNDSTPLTYYINLNSVNNSNNKQMNEFFNLKLIDSELPIRLLNTLLAEKLNQISDILNISVNELYNIRGVGKRSLLQLDQFFINHTGMTLERLKNHLKE